MIYNKHLVPTIGYIKISSNQNTLDLEDYITSLGFAITSGRLFVEIEAGVVISGDPAMSISGMGGIDLILINNGEINGKGGIGGNGASPSYPGGNGGIGKDGIFVSKVFSLINNSIISGGGGGGGGGGNSYDGGFDYVGGGGGGGAYLGDGGAASYSPSLDLWSIGGSNGGVLNGGNGGYFPDWYYGAINYGGSGGGIGRPGSNGSISAYTPTRAAGSGGLAGYYINGISNVIIVNPNISKGSCAISNGTPGVVTLSSHGLITGAQVTFQTTDELPSPLVVGTTYYAIKNDDNTMWLAISLANAIAGTKIATTTDGSGTHSMYYHGTFLGRVV